MSFHELTERVDCKGIGSYIEIKKNDCDKIIREWLEQKAVNLANSVDDVARKREILGLTHKSLDEKITEMSSKWPKVDGEVEEIVQTAKQHFKDHPEDLI